MIPIPPAMMIRRSVFRTEVCGEVYGPSRREGRFERGERCLVRPFPLRMKRVMPDVLVLPLLRFEEEESSRLMFASLDTAADFSMSSELPPRSGVSTPEAPLWCVFEINAVGMTENG